MIQAIQVIQYLCVTTLGDGRAGGRVSSSPSSSSEEVVGLLVVIGVIGVGLLGCVFDGIVLVPGWLGGRFTPPVGSDGAGLVVG